MSFSYGTGGGSGGGSSSSGDVVGPASSTDNAAVRFDTTTGKLVQNSAFIISDIATNKITVNTPIAATTGTAIEFAAGANSTASAAGGNLILSGGAGGAGGERGAIVLAGAANTAGNRWSLVSAADAIGYFGYDWAAGAYRRCHSAYFSNLLKIGATTSTEIGVDIGKGSVGGYISFIQSTANKGPSIQSEYAKCITVNQPSADGGLPYFSFGNVSDQTKNGQLWLHKSSEADIKLNTDGGGDLGGNGANRFRNLNLSGAYACGRQQVVATDGGSTTISDNTGVLNLIPAGTLATYTITMPANPLAGQIVIVCCTQIITTLTMNPNSGQVLRGALGTIAAEGYGSWYYTGSAWYRIG